MGEVSDGRKAFEDSLRRINELMEGMCAERDGLRLSLTDRSIVD